MIVRSVSALAITAVLAGTPANADPGVTPARVLAATGKHAKSTHDFADRTARMSSIMGPELSRTAPMNVPTRPSWHRTVQRDADAAGGLR